MKHTPWILLDTETTGVSAPIFVVELAAQRMRGWAAEGEPFRKLLVSGMGAAFYAGGCWPAKVAE